jgi:drug/metabolite transporter (DMT)-like permease
MPSPRDVHRGATRVFAVLMIVIGVAILVSTIARGGGPLAVGLLLGALFVAAGVGRLYLERQREKAG